jgi:predicted nucleic acid-binding protein
VPKAFFDTNVLVYQLDVRNSRKRDTCRNLVRKAASEGNAVISTQVLQEFYVVTTSKLRLAPLLIKSIMRSFGNMEVVTITTGLIDEAIDVCIQYQLSFWDSLVVVAAESAKCELLYSEDMKHGQILRGVKIANPMRKNMETG